MMSELTRLIDEANRLLTTYDEHKNSEEDWLRRKVHVDMDRFLMEHREIAMILMLQGLQDALTPPKPQPVKVKWYKRLVGGKLYAKSNNIQY